MLMALPSRRARTRLWRAMTSRPMAQKATVCKAARAARRCRSRRLRRPPRHPCAPPVRDRRADDGPPARVHAQRAGRRPRRPLDFAKGMWEPDEAELWQKDLTGRLVHWIEVGQPEERRLVKASGRADRVSVYAFSHGAPAWWAACRRRVGRAGNLDAWLVPSEQSRELALLAQTRHAAPGQPAGRHRLGRRRRPIGRDPPAPPVGGAA